MKAPAFAPVNRILRSSIVDGPGNRAAVFLQGCNFRCLYCHNPETIALCNHCGRCLSVCPTAALSWEQDVLGEEGRRTDGNPILATLSQEEETRDAPACETRGTRGTVRWDAARCTACDACIRICPHLASPRVRLMTAEDVLEVIQPSMDFIRGITVSGGECTLYPDFLRELGESVKARGRSFFLDTNGSYDFSKDPALLATTDGVMLDVKAPVGRLGDIMDGDGTRSAGNPLAGAGTGAKDIRGDKQCARDFWAEMDGRVVAQLKYLAVCEKLWEVRTVVSPGLTDAAGAVETVCRLLKESGAGILPRYKLIRYRPHGVRPKAAVRLAPPTDVDMESLTAICTHHGIESVIV